MGWHGSKKFQKVEMRLEPHPVGRARAGRLCWYLTTGPLLTPDLVAQLKNRLHHLSRVPGQVKVACVREGAAHALQWLQRVDVQRALVDKPTLAHPCLHSTEQLR